MVLQALVGRLEQAKALDPAVDSMTQKITKALPRGPVKDLLHGTWLGHPLHPLLVAVPIGLWSGALLLDLTGGPESRAAARRLVGAGVLAAVPTAASGWADWSELGIAKRPKRVGIVHAGANALTILAFAGSWLARRGEDRRSDGTAGLGLALAGAAGLSVGGYLGGHLAFAQAVGVNRNADQMVTPRDWTDAAAAGDLVEGTPLRVEVKDQAVGGLGLVHSR